MLKKYRDIFDGYDKEHDGYVLAKDIPAVFRILGVTISEQEGKNEIDLVVDMLGDRVLKSDNPLVSSKVDFADFLALIVCLNLLRSTRRDRSQ